MVHNLAAHVKQFIASGRDMVQGVENGWAQPDLQFFSHAKVEAWREKGQKKHRVCAQGWRDASQIPVLPFYLPIGMTGTEAFSYSQSYSEDKYNKKLRCSAAALCY